MSTKDKLIRVHADANPDADVFLRCTRIGHAKSEDGDTNESDFCAHTRMSRQERSCPNDARRASDAY